MSLKCVCSFLYAPLCKSECLSATRVLNLSFICVKQDYVIDLNFSYVRINLRHLGMELFLSVSAPRWSDIYGTINVVMEYILLSVSSIPHAEVSESLNA